MRELKKPSEQLLHTLAVNVRTLRHSRNLSQEQLAVESGLHRTYVGAVERAERNVSLSSLEALSGALFVSPADLLQDRETNDGC